METKMVSDSLYFRGFDDKDCDILRNNGISMTQIYKQAGNSIVVNVLQEVFKSLYRLK
jgi:DNA (cytosine-5)-methyltransferase 1